MLTKYPNHRSEFLFCVTENKQFKVKRNSLYKRVVKEMEKAGVINNDGNT